MSIELKTGSYFEISESLRVAAAERSASLLSTIVIVPGKSHAVSFLRYCAEKETSLFDVRVMSLANFVRNVIGKEESAQLLKTADKELTKLLVLKSLEKRGLSSFLSDESEVPHDMKLACAELLAGAYVDLKEALGRDFGSIERLFDDVEETVDANLKKTLGFLFEFDSEHSEKMSLPSEMLDKCAEILNRSEIEDLPQEIFVYGFHDMSASQERTIKALSSKKDLIIFLPEVAGDLLPSTSGLLERLGINAESTEESCLAERLFILETGRPVVEKTKPVKKFSASDEHAETEEIAQRIVELAKEGLAFRDICVVPLIGSIYYQLFENIFRRNGIPFYAFNETQKATPDAELAESFIKGCTGGWSKATIQDLFLCNSLGESQTEIASREFFIDCLPQLFKPEDLPELKERLLGRPKSKHHIRRVEEIDCFESHIDKTIKNFMEAVEIRGGLVEGTPAEISKVLQESILALKGSAIDPELLNMFNRISVLPCEKVTLSDVSVFFQGGLEISCNGRFLDAGVQVLPLKIARGAFFKHVFLLGCHEGGFPVSGRENLFLGSKHRRLIEKKLGIRLREGRRRFSEDMESLSLLLEGAENYHLSYSRIAGATLSQKLPSFMFKEISGKTAQDDSSEGEICEDIGRLSSRDEKSARLPHVFDLNALKKLRKSCEKYLEFIEKDLSRGVLVNGIRSNKKVLSKYSGSFVNEVTAGKMQGAFSLPETISFSQIETYFNCPFRYFLKYIIGVRDSREAGLGEFISGVDGGMVHEALRLTYDIMINRRHKAGGHLVVDEKLVAEISDEITEVSREVAEEINALMPVRGELAKQLQEIVSAYLLFNASGSELHAQQVEEEFRIAFKSVDDNDEVAIVLSGIIDRLDNSGDGRYSVVDYKHTNRFEIDENCFLKKSKQDDNRRSLAVQIPLYMYAIFSLMKDAEELKGEYVLTKEFPPKVIPVNIDKEKLFSGVGLIIDYFVKSARGGFFGEAPYRDDYCSSCDYRKCCLLGASRLGDITNTEDNSIIDFKEFMINFSQ